MSKTNSEALAEKFIKHMNRAGYTPSPVFEESIRKEFEMIEQVDEDINSDDFEEEHDSKPDFYSALMYAAEHML